MIFPNTTVFFKQPMTTLSFLTARSTLFMAMKKGEPSGAFLGDECQVFLEQCRCESLMESTEFFSVLSCPRVSMFLPRILFPLGIHACRQRKLIKRTREEHPVGCLVLIPLVQHLNDRLQHKCGTQSRAQSNNTPITSSSSNQHPVIDHMIWKQIASAAPSQQNR